MTVTGALCKACSDGDKTTLQASSLLATAAVLSHPLRVASTLAHLAQREQALVDGLRLLQTVALRLRRLLPLAACSRRQKRRARSTTASDELARNSKQKSMHYC